MKILLILPVNELPGKTGESIHIDSLCKAWISSGHTIHAITLQSKKKRGEVSENRFFIHELPFTLKPLNELNLRSINSILKLPIILVGAFFFSIYLNQSQKFDLVFIRYRPPFSSISLLFNLIFRKKSIIKIAGTAVYKFITLPFEDTIFKNLLKYSTYVVADNIFMKKYLEKFTYKDKILDIPPPITINYSEEKIQKKHEEFMILYICSFREDEDIFSFIRGCRIVMKKYPNISIIIVGDGPKKKSAKKLAKHLKVNLSFLDSVLHKEIPNILCNADVCVALYNSSYKAIPIKVLEYAIMKKPIITTANVARMFQYEMPNFIPEDCLLAVSLSPTEIANAIFDLYKKEEMRRLLSQNIFNYVIQNYSLGNISKRYLTLFDNIKNNSNHKAD